jgi:hypothetical protein
MIDLTGVTHHPALAEITDLICTRTQNQDKGFFRGLVAYYFGQMASSMRACIQTQEPTPIPISVFTIALGTSGYGKGKSVNVFENELLKGFRKRFVKDTLPTVAQQNFWALANEEALSNGTDPQEEYDRIEVAYKRQGPLKFVFTKGTTEAGIAQLRTKLLYAAAGSVNFQLDEIGLNLEKSADILNVFLELYDVGALKTKLLKNSQDNPRDEDLEGHTPTNMMLFGTPSSLFDGSSTEELFYSILEAGMARRCFFANGVADLDDSHLKTGAEIFAEGTKKGSAAIMKKWAAKFHTLADPAMFNWTASMDDETAILLLDYKLACEKTSKLIPDIDINQIKKAELSHRYFKAMKLAGAYAFIDQSSLIEMDHLKSAILLAEESGAMFQTIVYREKPHVKLGKYLASCGEEVTQHDLTNALRFYAKGGAQFRRDTMNLACSWGYKNNVIIKKTMVGEIEFFKAETLKPTNLDELHISLSQHYAYNYEEGVVAFSDLHQYTQSPGLHWINHSAKGGHRAEENILPGFDMIVIDVDGDMPLKTVHQLLKEYKFLTYTTKSHTKEENRFRLILPMNYRLYLDANEYKAFMNGVLSWLPFKSDESANQRSKKWETFDKGVYHYNREGALFDALPFIPKTAKNDAYRKASKEVSSLDNLERWFIERMVEGDRNNQMIKYALALLDDGMDFTEISEKVLALNGKLESPMDESRINASILVTVAKRLQQKAA